MIRLTGRDVARTVAAYYGISMADFTGPSRRRAIARPRQVAMYAVRQNCPHLSLPAIGRVFGFRDHTTILHGIRQVEALIETNPDVAADVVKVMALVMPMHTPSAIDLLPVSILPYLCADYARAMRGAA